jgi:DNA replication protein DnaC
VPFAGRRRELQEVGRLLDRAAGGAGGLLAITGAPGSGKTALAEAAAAEAAHRGFEILRASPAEHHPAAWSGPSCYATSTRQRTW